MSGSGKQLANPSERWPELNTVQRWTVGSTVLLIAALGVVHLPPGICFDDAGDLQMASTTLGIAHAPGYMGYVTVGWLACRILFFVEPAYVVSLLCLACMVAAIGLSIALLIRLGLHVLPACALGLLFVAHDSVWKNMVFPEVYAPSLALLVATCYLFFRYGRLHRAIDLYAAAGLFGFLVINRPPAVFVTPGLLIGLLVIERRFRAPMRVMLRRVGAVLACGTIPVFVVLAILWMRDTPETAYHTVERQRLLWGGMPEFDSDPSIRIARIKWIVGGGQFAHLIGGNSSQVRSKLRWIRRQLFVYETPRLMCLLAVSAVGFFALSRRGADWVLVLLSVIVGNLIFLCQYRVHGQAANLLPTLFGVLLVFGAVMAKSFPYDLTPPRRITVGIMFAMTCLWTIYHSTVRPNHARGADATRFLADADVSALPRNAVIFSKFGEMCPLWYSALVSHHRSDISVISSPFDMWPDLAQAYPNRPVFYADARAKPPPGWSLTPWRTFTRLERIQPERLSNE